MKKSFLIFLALVTGSTLFFFKSGDCACVTPPSGLVAWWPGDGNPNDIIGGKNGTFSETAAYAPGFVNQAFTFDGSGNYVTTPGIINGWAQGTIDLWVKFNALSDQSPTPIFSSIGVDPNLLSYFPIHLWASRETLTPGFVFGFLLCNKDNCVWQLAYNNTIPEIGRWYHLAGTWGPEGIKIHVDGVLKDTNADYKDAAPSTLGNVMGASVLSHPAFNGLIDEVEIFNRALSSTEILSIYNAGSAGKCRNNPPIAKCKDVTVSAGRSCSASASIDNGSYDPDGDPLELTQSPSGPYGLEKTTVVLTVRDSHGASSSCTGIVTVEDKSPPIISNMTTAPSTLWPPDHKMVPVRIGMRASDNCTIVPQCRIFSITSNEPVNGQGDGNTAPDWEFVPITTDSNKIFLVKLRAERSGQGSGRIYTIGAQCSDNSGNTSKVKNVLVEVPHDQGNDNRPLIRKKFKK